MPIVVEILSGARRGQRAVLEKPLVTLGRHPDNDVVFDERSEGLVSAFHAELHEIGPGRWVLKDRGSSNGTWVAGSRVTELAFEGRLEVQLAHDGPRVALMPLTEVPAQAADALATPGAMPRPTVPAGIDPLVVAPTMDGPHAGYRGPGRIGAASADRAPAKGSPGAPRYPSAPERPRATEAGGAPGSDVPPWQRTVSSAGPTVGAAMGRPPTTTAQIRAVAGDMVRRSSRRFWIVVAVLSLLLLGTGVTLALVLTGTVPLGGGGGGEKAASPAAVPATDAAGGAAAPVPAPKPSAKEIVERNKDAIYLLGAELLGRGEGFCTGFALTPRILATNAHCVKEMQKVWQALGDGQGVFAYQNEHPGVKFRVLFALMDPAYKEDDSDAIYPDIGLAVIDGRADRQVRLASKARAAQLRTGDHIYLLGFPGALNSAESPVATLTTGIVERLTDLSQRMASPETSVLLQHSAFTTKGTSGSPLFGEDGEVIGINTGYYRGESEQQRLDPVTGKLRDEMVTQDLQNYAIGMRIDLVHDLLRLLYERIPDTREEGAAP